MHNNIDFSRVGELASSAERSVISATGCICGVDPWSICPSHLCNCGHCGEDGRGCPWRARLGKFIETEGLAGVVAKSAGTLTYLHVLELSGRKGPASPRKRLLINLVANMPRSRPLKDTLMLVDISQNPPFCTMRTNRDAPTITCATDLWAFQAGESMNVRHYSALMGLNLSSVRVSEGTTDSWMRRRLGAAIHIGNFGVVLLAALAPPINRRRGS
jgi:hypothetical protein